jgi:hypothetical protein
MRRFKGFANAILLASVALDARGAVQLVAHKIAKDLTGAEVTAVSTPGFNSTAGNLILVWAVSYSGSQPVGYVTDSAGDTFAPTTLNKGTWFGQWFYAKNVRGEAFNVVTIHPAMTGRATLTYPGMSVLELSGADKFDPIAANTAGPQGALTAWTSNPFDVASGGAALLGVVTANGGAFTAGPGFKIEDSYLTPNSGKFSFAALDQLFSAAQAGVTANVAWTGTLQATGAVVVIKPAGS